MTEIMPGTHPPTSNRFVYLDGLRGVTALVVVICHFFQIFLPAAFSPASPDHFGERYLALTPINILFNGNFAVSVFFVLSGFVLSAPFFSGASPHWYLNAALKRYPRLAIPALSSTILAWIVALTIGFHYGQTKAMSGADMPDFFATISSLGTAIWEGSIGSFFFNQNDYNKVLWTIKTELLGSFIVLCTIPLIGRYKLRWIAYAIGMYAFSDSYLLGFVLGALIADLRIKFLPRLSSTALLVAGLYLGSYPYHSQASSIWSPLAAIPHINVFLLTHLLGAALCIMALCANNPAGRYLETRPARFLGRISFSMYLIHFTFWGSAGSWLVLALAPALGYAAALALAFLASLPVIFLISYAFTVLIDEPAVRIANRLSQRCIAFSKNAFRKKIPTA
jgi:peptidoglycan/LPS O-acetylase OafA/YrhL